MTQFISDYSKSEHGAREDGRFSSPAFERNHAPILNALEPCFSGPPAHILEIGSGPGQHISLFAKKFPDHTFWPTDPIANHLKSVAAWRDFHGTKNVMEAARLDAADEDWDLGAPGRPPALDYRMIFSINVFHIAPWRAVCGILRGAGRHLAPNGVLAVYGPFSIAGAHVSESNREFDRSLRESDPEMGVRDSGEIADEAQKHGLVISEIVKMPANNFIIIIKRE